MVIGVLPPGVAVDVELVLSDQIAAAAANYRVPPPTGVASAVDVAVRDP
jgi:hypothetical protein